MPSLLTTSFPPDVTLLAVSDVDGVLCVDAQLAAFCQLCPCCGEDAVRVHSRYVRHIRDLPVLDRPLRVRLQVRRFFCDNDSCPRRTFAEQAPAFVPARARRSARLTTSLRAIGFATGGEAGARLARRLRMPVSGDTLLRILRATPDGAGAPPTVIGIDDFALRKGRVYGTILVDLERGVPIDLLPDRTEQTVAARLQADPQIRVVARDRSPQYARGVTAGAPQATQVADRFHLLSSFREAIERYVQRVRPDLRRLLHDPGTTDASSAAVLDAPPSPRYDPGPARLQIKAARHAERERRFRQVKEAQERGRRPYEIAALTGLSRPTVRLWMTADIVPPERRGYRVGGKVEPYGPYLQRRLADGCTHQTRLWQEIAAQGFVGTRSLVSKWIRAHQSSDLSRLSTRDPLRLPGPHALAWLVLRVHEDDLADDDRLLWERLRHSEELTWVQGMAADFVGLVRERRCDALDVWLTQSHTGGVPEMHQFALGLERDGAAVRAALTLPWSNGPTEGHINKLNNVSWDDRRWIISWQSEDVRRSIAAR